MGDHHPTDVVFLLFPVPHALAQVIHFPFATSLDFKSYGVPRARHMSEMTLGRAPFSKRKPRPSRKISGI